MYSIGIVMLLAITFGIFGIIQWSGFVPLLVPLVVITIALAVDSYDYVFVALLGGIWFEVLYSVPVGTITIGSVIAGLLVTVAFRRWLYSEVTWKNFLAIVLFTTIWMYLWMWLYTTVLYHAGWARLPISGLQLLRHGAWGLVANVLFAYPIYIIIELLVQYALRMKGSPLRLK